MYKYLITSVFLTMFCQNIMADPIFSKVLITCPCTPDLKLVDGTITGEGSELIFEQNNAIHFTSEASQTNPDLKNYQMTGIAYDEVLGKISCNYTSTLPEEPDLTLIYLMKNGSGGLVQMSSINAISILLPLGFY